MDTATGRARRVSEPPTAIGRSLLQDGDIVVARESRSAASYTVRQLPGVVQLSASSRDAALRLARGFAQKHAVDLWYSEGDTYKLLEAYRRRGSTER